MPPTSSPDSDLKEVAVRKLLMFFPAESHRDLDNRLEALWRDVSSGALLDSLQATAKRLIDDLQGDSSKPDPPRLVMRGRAGWEARWESSQNDGLGLFVDGQITSNPVVHALSDVLLRMAMLVKESNTSVDEDDHKTALEKSIRRYLELRGRVPGKASPPSDARRSEKILHQDEGGNTSSNPGRVQPLAVDIQHMTLTLNGTVIDVSSEQALRWIAVLAKYAGQWFSARELEIADPELVRPRTERLKKKLPQAVQLLIESRPGKGSRLRMA